MCTSTLITISASETELLEYNASNGHKECTKLETAHHCFIEVYFDVIVN